MSKLRSVAQIPSRLSLSSLSELDRGLADAEYVARQKWKTEDLKPVLSESVSSKELK